MRDVITIISQWNSVLCFHRTETTLVHDEKSRYADLETGYFHRIQRNENIHSIFDNLSKVFVISIFLLLTEKNEIQTQLLLEK